MTDIESDAFALEQQLAALATSGEALDILTRLAEAVFPEGRGFGRPERVLWPEGDRQHSAERTTLRFQLERSEKRLRTLLEQIPAVVFIAALGTEQNEVYVSPQIESLLGFTQQEWLNNPLLWYSQLHPDDHMAVIESFTAGVQTGGPFRAEVRFFARDGHEVWISGEAHLLRDANGRPEYFQGVGFDITESKRAARMKAEAEHAQAEAERARAEALSAANEQLSQLNAELQIARDRAEESAAARAAFLATMSHELRTPMNSVVVLSGLLADTALTDTQREMVRNISLSADHLTTLINNILDLSRLRSGRPELNLQTLSLEELIEDCLDIVAPKAADKDISLSYLVQPGTPTTLRADDTRLRQMLLNLLGNAVKFTERGQVHLTVDAHPNPDNRWTYSCAVRDTGIGIAPDRIDDLFVEFEQADSGIARRYGGSGLGLAISRAIAELHGGTISVSSEVGAGSVFTLSFVAEAEPPAPRVTDPELVGTRLLVVDDADMELDSFVSAARSLGLDVDGTVSPEQALAWLQQGRTYDLVVVDYALGLRDGVAFAHEIASYAGARRVAVMSHAVYADRVDGRSGTHVGFLVKPIRRTRLPTQLKALLANGDAIPPVSSHPRPPSERATLRLLVAEDNEFNQQLLQMLLAALGFAEADVVDSGDGAIAAVEATAYDVVLMDVMMPVTDGITATRTIRARGASIHQPFIVALTAAALPGDKEACLAAGMDAFISKPIDRDELAALLDERVEASGHDTPRPLPTAVPEPDDDVDPAIAQSLILSLGPESFGRLLATFDSASAQSIADLRTAIAARDAARVRLSAHSLKAGARAMGALALSDLCEAVETSARDESWDTVTEDTGARIARLRQDALQVLERLAAPRTL